METLGRLAVGIAHDFNNLLSVIQTYTDFAVERTGPDSPAAPDLREIRHASQRAAALTGKLLAFCWRQVVRPELVDLNVVVGELRPLFERLLGRDVRLTMKLAGAVGLSRLDRAQVEQVVMNLVVNARDAMPNGGALTVETADVTLDAHFVATHLDVAPGPYVLLAVSDTGAGMDAATRARAFEPFYTTKAVGHGTGLGLSTVYGIVKQSGGSIWLYSEPGQGTSFKIYFPREAVAAATSAAQEPAPAPPAAPAGGETVLVVDDEPMLLAAAERILSSEGYAVLSARRADEALDLAIALPATRRLDLVVADLVLPGTTGPALVQRLLGVHPHLKVLFTSGYTEEAIAQHGLVGSGARVATKPYNAARLAHEVRAALGASGAAKTA